MPSRPVDATSCGASPSSPLHSEGRSSASAAATGWRPTGWGDLPTDWLGCILEFLSLRDSLSSVLPVCRSWRDGLHAVTPCQETLTLNERRLAELADESATIRQHVTRLRLEDVLSHESLALTCRLPRLTRLEGRIEWSRDDGNSDEIQQLRQFELPPRLTTLKLTLTLAVDDGGILRWTQLERILDDVAQVATLTQLDVFLKGHGQLAPALIPLKTMQPLARLRDSLTDLSIQCGVFAFAGVPALSRPHVDFLCSLHRLESIALHEVAGWTAQELEWVTEPMATRIKFIGDQRFCVDDAHAAALSRFTSLVKFVPSCLGLRDPSFLVNFKQLNTARITCQPVVDPVLLAAALTSCTELTALSIEHPGITSDHLCSLLPSLPRLTYLCLTGAESLTSLLFASSTGHLALTLKRLAIRWCAALAPDEVHHLRALTALRELDLSQSFSTPLDDDTIDSMLSGSSLFARDVWPHLEHVWCEHARARR